MLIYLWAWIPFHKTCRPPLGPEDHQWMAQLIIFFIFLKAGAYAYAYVARL